MSVQYFIWSGKELLGSVHEINLTTALQKAKLIARFYDKKHYTVSTSAILHEQVFASGTTVSTAKRPDSSFLQMAAILIGK